MAPSRQLLLRIYVVILTQLLLVAGTIALVGWLTFKPDPKFGPGRDAPYVIENLRERLDQPAALRRELDKVSRHLHAQVSLYDADDKLLASNVDPPLRAAAEERAELIRSGRIVHLERRPKVLAPLDPKRPDGSYVLYRSGRPPPPPLLWVLLIALIGATIASVVLARSLVEPLASLTALARKLGEGDLSARARSTRRDEFGQLAAAFDDMADRLTLVLRSQQELLANVSHELRTPLARIRVALDIAAEGNAETAREALSEITTDLLELERLVADVLQTAKLDLATGRAGQALPLLRRGELEADALIEQAATRFRTAHPQRELEVVQEQPLPLLLGDGVLLRRALDNLLDNAHAYSDEGDAVRLVATTHADKLSLAVIDRGIGIAQDDLPHVSTPFFRTDPSRARRTGGLGLGLSLARRIVEAHDGSLTIESELGRGTTVRMELPVAG